MKVFNFTYRITTLIFIMVFTLLTDLGVQAQDFQFGGVSTTVRKSATDVLSNATVSGLNYTFTTYHDKWADMTTVGSSWYQRYKMKSVQTVVDFGIDQAYFPAIASAYRLKLVYELKGYSNP